MSKNLKIAVATFISMLIALCFAANAIASNDPYADTNPYVQIRQNVLDHERSSAAFDKRMMSQYLGTIDSYNRTTFEMFKQLKKAGYICSDGPLDTMKCHKPKTVKK